MAVAAPVATPPLPAAPNPAELQSALTERDTQLAEIGKQKDAALDPIRESAKATIANTDKILAEPVKKAPLPENMAKHMDPKQMMDTAQIFMTLGALGGLFMRQPLTAALGNMTAAMKGVHDGDAEQFDRATAEFKTNFDKAMKINDEAAKERTRILNDNKLSLTEKMNLLDIESSKYGDMTTRATTSFKGKMEMYNAKEKAATDARKAVETWEKNHAQIEHWRNQDAAARARAGTGGGGSGSGGAAGGLSDAAKQMFADMQMRGIKAPDISGRKEVAAQKIAIANIMAEKYAKDGTVPTEIQVNRDMHAALTKALAQTTSRVTGIELGSRKIEKDIETMKRYMAAGSPDNAKIIGKLENKLRSAMSDPTLAPYALAVKQVATEYERLMVGGMLSVAQLHEGAREDAKRILSEDMTIAEVNAVLPVMLAEIKNQKEAAHETIADLKSQINGVGGAGAPGGKPGGAAPASALSHLKAHPELKDQFKAKYGYLPE